MANLKERLIKSKVGRGTHEDFIRYNRNNGRWERGINRENVTGFEVCIDPFSIKHGWIIWDDGNSHKVIVDFDESLPAAPEPINGNNPSELRSFVCEFNYGDSLYSFESNSYGARNAIDSLVKIIAEQAQNSDMVYPVVSLETSSFKNRSSGETFNNPIFEVVSWKNYFRGGHE